jgi:hypothetical protein
VLLICPPGTNFSSSSVLNRSLAVYNPAANPAGPAPIIMQSYLSAIPVILYFL